MDGRHPNRVSIECPIGAISIPFICKVEAIPAQRDKLGKPYGKTQEGRPELRVVTLDNVLCRLEKCCLHRVRLSMFFLFLLPGC